LAPQELRGRPVRYMEDPIDEGRHFFVLYRHIKMSGVVSKGV